MTFPILVMYVSAEADESLRQKLERHLALLEQQGLMQGWHTQQIEAGSGKAESRESAFLKASLILLLISADFFASPICREQMQRAIERQKKGEVGVIPILLRAVDGKDAPFEHLQALPTNGQPVTLWRNQDVAWAHITEAVRYVLEGKPLYLMSEAKQVERSPAEKQYQVPVSNLPRNREADFEVSTGEILHYRLSSNLETVFLFNVRLPKFSEFYGRRYERFALLSQSKVHGSTSIVGLRRIGKTWLLQYLMLRLQFDQGSNARTGYLDATAPSCATLESFTAEALKALGIAGSPHKNGLVILEEFVKSKSKNKNQCLVLCIDEFEGLGKKPDFDSNFFKHMRAIAQAGLTLVTASKSSLYDIVGEPGETSGFFNIFQQLTLAPFTYNEARNFVEEKGIQAGFTEQEQNILLKYGQIEHFKGRRAWSPARLQRTGKILLGDIYLAKTEDPDCYRPDDANYWQNFENRLNDGDGEMS